VNPCILHRNNRTACPTYIIIIRLKEDALLPTRYLAVQINNCLKRTFVIKVAITDDFRNKWKQSHAIDAFRGQQR